MTPPLPTVAELYAAFPSFNPGGAGVGIDLEHDGQVLAALTFAAAATSDSWDNDARYPEYIMLKACERLTESPVGRDARVVTPGEAETTFTRARKKLEKSHAFAHPLRLGIIRR